MKLENAVERAITECIQEGILADFLKKNRAEAKRMSMFEFNEEKHLRLEKEYSREEGFAAGQREGHRGGFAAGKECINELKQKLLTEGRTDELARTILDPEYQRALMEKYGLLAENV
ncbi:MAG: hypothetical protein Q4C59_10070 [Lachnospiraceae bacterium]|nr:hypothetical protein [Lachnospiraceae bacterium]